MMTFDKKLRKMVVLFFGLMAILCLAMGVYHAIIDKPLGSLTTSFLICLLLISNLKKDEKILSLIEKNNEN